MLRKLSSIATPVVFYFIATFFFCHDNNASVINCSSTDLEALLDFKSGLNDPVGRLSSWRSHSNCCQWNGIGCDTRNGAVIEVDLHNPYPVTGEDFVGKYRFLNMSGEIRPSLLKIRSLRYLDLSCNTFEGITIPEFLGSLNNLQYLNLSKAGFVGSVPATLGNLSSLQYLDISSDYPPSLGANSLRWVSGLVSLRSLYLSNLDLSSIESNWLETLNMLPYLTELHLSSTGLPARSISSLSYVNFTSLAVIDLSMNSFLDVFPSWLVNVSTLTYVNLFSCDLRGNIPLGFSEIPNLRYLHLALNDNLSVGIHKFLNGTWNRIESLSLGSYKVHGKLPSTIGNMVFLTDLILLISSIEGSIPSSIGKLCNLANLDISVNKLSGNLPESLEASETCGYNSPLPRLRKLSVSNNQLTGKLPDWLGQLSELEELTLSYNLFDGPIPHSIGSLRHLYDIQLQGNKLTGTLPESFGQLPKLTSLDVSFNELRGTISENHLANSNLSNLQLTSNSLTLNFSSDWIPPFQVYNLGIGSCKIGPSFPAWLKHQNDIHFLDLSNASISGPVPEWFWDHSVNLSLLNFSHNQLQGVLPNPIVLDSYADLDLSFNFFEGSIPLPVNPIELFDLSNNRFEGNIPENMSDSMPDLVFLSLSGNNLTGDIPPSIGKMVSLNVMDLSVNSLTGSIPDVGNCLYLNALDLGYNALSGGIPTSLGQLDQLRSLHFNDNKLSGEIPSSFQNLSNLETLDVRNNMLSANMPSLFEYGFGHLRILSLRKNRFRGNISMWNTSNMMSLQVLDLAENYLYGSVPASFGDLQAMTRKPNLTEYLLYGKYRGSYYEEGVVINFQNSQKYTKTLSLLTAIDISDNDFSGEFPSQLIKLSSLRALNMSRNNISGQIPQDISSLDQLLLLDLSSNKLSGGIPPSMVSMSPLGYMNLSNNNLSGAIPYTGQLSTFSSSSFEGNPNLCGGPLESCQNDKSERYQYHSGDEQYIDEWFYLSLGLGFFLAILVPFLILSVRRPWRDAYLNFVDNVAYRLLIHIGQQPRNRNRNVRPQIRFHT